MGIFNASNMAECMNYCYDIPRCVAVQYDERSKVNNCQAKRVCEDVTMYNTSYNMQRIFLAHLGEISSKLSLFYLVLVYIIYGFVWYTFEYG